MLQKQLKVCVRERGVSAAETAQGMCEREGVSATETQLNVCVRGRGVSATETAQGMCERKGSVCYRNSSRYV